MTILPGCLQQIMAALEQALQDEALCRATGVRQLVLTFYSPQDLPLLGWLAAQPHFPKFYWQPRDGTETVAVCGQVAQFDDPAQAGQFLQHHVEGAERLRVWGLNAFEAVPQPGGTQQACLFVPRLTLHQQANTLTLTLNLADPHALQGDLTRAAAFLQQLQPVAMLSPLNLTLTHACHQPDEAGWEAMLRRALAEIADGVMEKVVLARKTVLTFSQPVDAWRMLAASRQVNHHCYHFLMAFSPTMAFLSASPERLFLRQGDQLTTEALAGTVAGSDDDSQAVALAAWLMKSEKNQRENWLVVDDICRQLQDEAHGLDVMPPEIVRLRNVQHLRRSIHGQLRAANDALCLARLQPTAAVAGLPRRPARRFILSHEPFARHWYAGSAGYLSRGQSEFAVSLRSALLEGNQVHLYAGAGIVAGSDPAQEWQEIENKAAGLRTLLHTPAVQ
ncbi:isochorismate synthase MenF [Chimaeribacter arupi]|uniref:isochorismate synthase MenF n=1 Tax=Chimaeribacter arupi TaxID=2060066 RepID=UPI00294647BB|nr:isochorismate synthase MenF [Chimaeribacter arupi]MDV5140503.1 isochorismate synthase MenF [Chimaeribacter arupi]